MAKSSQGEHDICCAGLVFCLGLFCTFVYVRMYVSVCNFSELVCDLVPRQLLDGFC